MKLSRNFAARTGLQDDLTARARNITLGLPADQAIILIPWAAAFDPAFPAL
jgi:hypothetical protein